MLQRLIRRLRAIDRWFTSDYRIIILSIASWFLLKQLLYIGEKFENCLGDYLNETGYLDSSIKVDAFNGSRMLCRIMINIDLSVKFFALNYAYNQVNFTDSERACMRSRIGGHEYVVKTLQQELYNRSTTMTRDEINAKLAKLDEWFTRNREDNYYRCMDLTNEHWFFNHVFNVSKISIEPSDVHMQTREFCLKQYLSKERLLQSDFNLTTDSQVNVHEIICRSAIIEPFKNNVIAPAFWHFLKIVVEELGFEKKMCVIDQVEKSLLIEKLLAVSVAANYGMTDEQRKVELEHFDRMYRRFFRALHVHCIGK